MNEKLPKIIEAIAPLLFFLFWVIIVILLSILSAREQRKQKKPTKPAPIPSRPHPQTRAPTRESARILREEEAFARSWDEMISVGESLVPSAPSLLLHEEELAYTRGKAKTRPLKIDKFLKPSAIPEAFVLSQCFAPPRAVYCDFPLAMRIILRYYR